MYRAMRPELDLNIEPKRSRCIERALIRRSNAQSYQEPRGRMRK